MDGANEEIKNHVEQKFSEDLDQARKDFEREVMLACCDYGVDLERARKTYEAALNIAWEKYKALLY